MASTNSSGNFLRWRAGRQRTGYDKMLLVASRFLLRFDCYLLRFRTGSEVPEHTDPVDGKRHYRLNLVLKEASEGGEFFCASTIFETRRLKLFRSMMSAGR